MPEGALEVLSQDEVNRLRSTDKGGHHELLRRCALAVLNSGSTTDDTREVLEQYRNFEVSIIQQDRGVKLALFDAPGSAFVDGEMIRGIRELLFAVVRDVVYINSQITTGHFDLDSSHGITNAVFHILRNASVLKVGMEPNLVVCWGGHSISREEYDYTKKTGYELGLRKLNVCTGCGAGAMKGPMKGATIGHSKQRIRNGRYIGVTEPGIIAAESPNPIVNELVIMPDMEKRLEGFVRIAHAIVIFPGGVGTAEEILFLLGILLHPDNESIPLPMILTGPESSRAYLEHVDAFISATLGPAARQRYQIIIGDPAAVGAWATDSVRRVRDFRFGNSDAYYYNWRLRIESVFQQPFVATHESMANLEISRDLPTQELAANLRRAFSGIVSGNIREDGIRAIEDHGPFEIRGDKTIMARLDSLLRAFVEQNRMKLPGRRYEPCFRVVV
ncbi:MAG: LOG family protein [Chromatiales bacterium]|jgi:predicted Rossmann-fold nucleotide-binding protein|nr:MAG: LOG family protein [Chromatiales bacterium]